MARKGILTPDLGAAPAQETPKPRMMPRGAVGALQSSLSKLQENSVTEIDCALIDDAGYEDRLGINSEAQRQLVESLRSYGQQVPVLLRPHPKDKGRYEIVYGRRRLRALRELGLPVKAMVRQLDDHALVMAQGQENTARQDLSFIEKASFAAQLQTDGYDRQTIAAALSMDLPMVSRMLKVGNAFRLDLLKQIGSAPSIGRERWMALAKCFEDSAARGRAGAFMNRPEFTLLDSDGRFEAVLKRAQGKPATPAPAPARPKAQVRSVTRSDGQPLAELKTTAKGLTLTIPAETADGFDTWLETNADAVLADLHDRWTQERSED